MVLVVRLQRGGPILFLFTLVSFVCADYYIDDTNTTLTYTSGPNAAWASYAIGGVTLELLLPNNTYQVIDAFVCWNHTYRYAACFDSDTCLLTVPFTGSGITVYVYQAGPVGINASITIDTVHAKTNVLSAPPAPAYEIANVSMFDVQQLPSGPHTLSLLINNLSGSYSGMMFDYAYVNESLVTNSTTTTSTMATSTTVSTSAPASLSSGSHTDTGAIVGGVIAVVAVIVAGILASLWIRRRREHTPEMIDRRSGSATPPFNPHNAYDLPPGSTVRSGLTPSHSMEFSSLIPLAPNRLGSSEVRRTPSSPSSGQEILTPFTAIPATNSSGTQGHKTHPVPLNDSTNMPQIEHSSSGSHRDTSLMLTDEQADFINSLYHNNVPAAAIARVMERMLADRHAGIREWERETRLARGRTTMTTAPPSYEMIAEKE
ncbi:hypothetical protein J3R83DRAFT_1746 [Lanmaoa asiatica]|nr:hypothetical protein J3R83DRAFT_1746 [Lanmaoa asiatica]